MCPSCAHTVDVYDAFVHIGHSRAWLRVPVHIDDEIDLARRLVIAALALRYGDRVREAVRVVDHAEGARRALGVEALDVLLTRTEMSAALPLIRHDAEPRAEGKVARQPDAWIADITDDPEGIWRSAWLAICARHASFASPTSAPAS